MGGDHGGAPGSAESGCGVSVEAGVGQCPKRDEGLGHVWAGVAKSGDERNPCKFGCGTSGREYFKAATRARAALFSGLKAPMQSGTGKVAKP